MAVQSPTTVELQAMLGKAVQSAQRGDLLGARQIARDALAKIGDGEDATPFHAFLGMINARMGEPEAAIDHLIQAHDFKPSDVTIAVNLVSLLVETGRDQEAFDVATIELARADKSLRIARFRGFLAQKLEKFADAVQAYELVLAQIPDDFECWNNLGNALVGTGDYEAAVSALKRAVELDPRAAPTRINLATALLEIGREDEAEEVLIQASADFPLDSRPPYQLYVLYKNQQRQEDALVQIERTVSLDPEVAGSQLKLAIEYGAVRRVEDAERAYRKTIELNPLELDAYLGLAIQYEHSNREDMFASLIEEARANGISSDSLAFIEALEFRRLKEFEKALERIDAVSPDIEEVRTAHIRATLLERLGHTEEAFHAYANANRLMEEAPSEPLKRAEQLRDELTADIALLTPQWRDSWSNASPTDERADPVFLVGFPRSGTTLLDTFLMGHPDTVVMEEQPPLNTVEKMLGGSAALAEMDEAALAKARDLYFEEVLKLQPLEPGQTLVDKSPLFLYRLPLIKRLFPKAKFILALRHPCDVVLSCFMSNFRPNPAMANFLRLEDAAAFYELCFTHWTKSLELFDMPVFTIKYEELVEDVEKEVRPLVEWLGLEWHEDLLDHTATARSRGLITTASYSQVVEPIYKRASGRWLRYREHLEPIFDALDPWAREFGYGPIREEVALAQDGE